MIAQSGLQSANSRQIEEVELDGSPPERFAAVVAPERLEQILDAVARTKELLGGRVLWNVNSTASGGGVAEMLTVLLAYARGAGVDARWTVVKGDPPFFAITKRLHNWLHGAPGDGGDLGERERAHYAELTASRAVELSKRLQPGDVVLLHDPQTAGMASTLIDAGVSVVWRCHVGRDEPNDLSRAGWEFLREFLEDVSTCVFSRAEYVPEYMEESRVRVIAPSIDPFSPKNQDLSPGQVRAILDAVGLIEDGAGAHPTFMRHGGLEGNVGHRVRVVGAAPIPPDDPLVVQVSRWDRLKDMPGVMHAFVDYVWPHHPNSRLALVGPDVEGVSDDPEGQGVLAECVADWQALPEAVRQRISLVSVPMADLDENAATINAIQRHASVVAQKSLVEGFGLTVSEAMWKARPVVGSAVGGIKDQIIPGESGVLISDPRDLEAFGEAVAAILSDHNYAARLGDNARLRVLDHFLGDRHLIQWSDILAKI